jgi:hypothetical protein
MDQEQHAHMLGCLQTMGGRKSHIQRTVTHRSSERPQRPLSKTPSRDRSLSNIQASLDTKCKAIDGFRKTLF